MSYWLNLAIAFDQLLNALFAGSPDETLSARAYRLSVERGRHWPRRVIDGLFLVLFWQRSHCQQAHASELLRKHLPPQYNATTLTMKEPS